MVAKGATHKKAGEKLTFLALRCSICFDGEVWDRGLQSVQT